MHKTKCFNLKHHPFKVMCKNKLKYALKITQIRKNVYIEKKNWNNILINIKNICDFETLS